MTVVMRAVGARRPVPWGQGALLLLLAAFALVAGLGTAVVGSLAAIGFLAIVAGTIAFFLPLPWLVVLLFLTSFLVTGQVIYFARFDKALWFPFLLGALLLVRYPVDRMLHAGRADNAPRAMPGLSVGLFVYFAVALAASAINAVRPLQLFVSTKEYLFLWSVYLLIAAGLLGPGLVRGLWRWLPWLVVLQLPLIFYQRFVVVPNRAARALGAEWDAVVGAFGGNPDGGGSSGAMGIFCVLVLTLAVGRWRKRDLSGRATLALALGAALSIVLAEVKFAILLLPLAFGTLFLREILRRPLLGLGAIALAAGMAATVLVAYQAQYSRSAAGETVGEYFEGMFSGSTDSNFVNLRTREIGRVAALRFWAAQHGLDQPAPMLIGHGVGSSRVGELVVGDAARNWPFNIGRSALAMLLWEVGVLGVVALVVGLGSALLSAIRLMGQPALSPGDQALAGGCAVAILLTVASLPYNTDFLFAHQTQLVLMLALGTLVMLHRQLAGPRRAP